MTVLLGMASALCYGVADWCGGRAGRRRSPIVVTVLAQAVSLLLVGGLAALVSGGPPHWRDLGLGAIAGLAAAVALTLLYRALAQGEAVVVAPLSAVTAAGLPVVVGLLAGEDPGSAALVGMGVALVAVAVVGLAPGRTAGNPTIIMTALASGLAGGAMFLGLAGTSPASGLWPLVAARATSVAVLGAVLVVRGTRSGSGGGRVGGLVCLIGVCDLAANTLYLEAARTGLLSVAAVVSSLYPVVTIALAGAVDRQRPTAVQTAGAVLALVALLLIAAG